jgi:hypothetical protein
MPTGALDGPNSKTRRSKPGWWAVRTATSCAWAFGSPPFWAGQAAGGAEPPPWVGLGLGVGLALGDGVGAEVGDGRATLAVAEGAVVGAGVDGGTATGPGWSASTTTTAIATTTVPMRRSRPITPRSVTGSARVVDNRYKLRLICTQSVRRYEIW